MPSRIGLHVRAVCRGMRYAGACQRSQPQAAPRRASTRSASKCSADLRTAAAHLVPRRSFRATYTEKDADTRNVQLSSGARLPGTVLWDLSGPTPPMPTETAALVRAGALHGGAVEWGHACALCRRASQAQGHECTAAGSAGGQGTGTARTTAPPPSPHMGPPSSPHPSGSPNLTTRRHGAEPRAC